MYTAAIPPIADIAAVTAVAVTCAHPYGSAVKAADIPISTVITHMTTTL
jgi:hypothetical protein